MLKVLGAKQIEKNPYMTSSFTPPEYPHTHEFFEIAFCVKGEAVNVVNDLPLPFKKGVCVILRPGDVHAVQNYDPLKYEHIDIYSFEEAFKSICYSGSPILYEKIMNETQPITFSLPDYVFEYVYNSVLTLKEMFLNNSPFLSTIHTNIINAILSEYVKNSTFNEKHLPSWLNDLLHKFNQIDFLANNISTLANSVGYSLPYFSKSFKKYMGMSAIKYLIHKRIDVSKELLVSNPNLSIMNIANLLGFENPSTYSKHFLTLNKMTPREYRQKINGISSNNEPSSGA